MKRILLFAATNIAVLVVITVVARIFGLDEYLAARGQSFGGLLMLSAIFGFGGALISLAMSKTMAKVSMGVRVIKQPQSEAEQWLANMVAQYARQLGLGMPEVGVFESDDMNAFATGASRNNALVAVSTGLMRGMDRGAAAAVVGHEMTHVANGDMVTMTLLQGVVNTFVIFFARVVGSILDSALSGGRGEQRRGAGPFYFLIVIVLQIVFGSLATIIVMAFSRQREFRADAGGARLAGRDRMIGALRALESAHGEALPGQLQAFGIHGGTGAFLGRLFMSHPPLPERIAALQRVM